MGHPAQHNAAQDIWYDARYGGGITGLERSMSAETGPVKMPQVYHAIVREKLVPGSRIHASDARVTGCQEAAAPIALAALRAVHTDRYLRAIMTGEPGGLARSQGLDEWTRGIARGWLLNAGGLLAAARWAIEKNTITANLGHGYHHASPERGSGYCTLNGLAVVAKLLAAEGKRTLIVDLDQHEGDGTAECLLGEPNVWNVTIYGSPMGGPGTAPNNRTLEVKHHGLEAGAHRDVNYLAAISSRLPGLIEELRPELILYQAGVDPHDCAEITPQALDVRDRYVFALARSFDIPVTWVLAGGYAKMATLVRLHTNTVRAASWALEKVKAGRLGASRAGATGDDPYARRSRGGRAYFANWVELNRRLNGEERVRERSALSAAEIATQVARRTALMAEQRLPDDELERALGRLFER